MAQQQGVENPVARADLKGWKRGEGAQLFAPFLFYFCLAPFSPIRPLDGGVWAAYVALLSGQTPLWRS
ncbi:hypothetical protein CAF53_15130 [Sphingobium sp. LB126]|nr:hypothetical protein CAF53_15130 [Sphingobium sp. LB126]